MADEFAHFQDSQPILRETAIASRGEGYDNLSKIGEGIEKIASAKAESLAEEESTTQLMTANNSLGKVTTQAKLNMMQDSSSKNISQTLQTWKETSDAIKNQTPLNKYDRSRLDKFTSDTENQLQLQGARLGIQTSKKVMNMTYWDNLSGNLDRLKSFVQTGNYKDAESLGMSMMHDAKNMHDTGVITGSQFLAHQKMISSFIDHATNLHEALSKDFSSKDYHNANSFPFGKTDNDDLHTKPADQNTSHLTQNHLDDVSFDNQYATAIKSGKVDPKALATLSSKPHLLTKVVAAAQGANDASSYLTSNTGWTEFVAKYDELKNQPSNTMNAYKTGMKEHMGYIINNLNNGHYNEIMSDTVLGAQANNQFRLQASAIEEKFNTNSAQDVASRQQLNIDNLNQYTTHMVSIGVSSHMPNPWIKPFHEEFLAPIHAAFQKGSDPSSALLGMESLQPQNKIYLVNSMPNAKSQEVMRIVALSSENTSKDFQKRMIIFNQSNQDFSALKVDRVKDAKITAKIQAALGDYLDYQYKNGNSTSLLGQDVGSITGESIRQDGQTRQAASLNSFVNYVKGKAIEANDFEVSNVDNYVSDLKKNMSTVTNLVSGWNYQVNNRNLGATTKQDIDAAMNKAMIAAKDITHEGGTESQYQSAMDKNPLFGTIDQFNNIVITDVKSKAVIYSHPFTSSYVTDAHDLQKRIDVERRAQSVQNESNLHDIISG